MNQRFWVVLAVAVAAGLLVTVAPGPFNAWTTIMGLMLGSILLSVCPREAMSVWERATLAQVWSLVAIIVFGRALQPLLVSLQQPNLSHARLSFVLWAVVAAVLYAILGRGKQAGA